MEVDSPAVGPVFLGEGDADLLGVGERSEMLPVGEVLSCHFSNKLGCMPASRIVIGEDCRMSKWNPIVSGRRAWAAVRDLSRRWCLGVGAGPARRVVAHRYGREAHGARKIIAERRADAVRMGASPGLAAIAARSMRPKIATLKFLCQFPAASVFSLLQREKPPCSANHEGSVFNTYFIDNKRLIGDERGKMSNPSGMFWKFLPELRDSSGARAPPSHREVFGLGVVDDDGRGRLLGRGRAGLPRRG